MAPVVVVDPRGAARRDRVLGVGPLARALAACGERPEQQDREDSATAAAQRPSWGSTCRGAAARPRVHRRRRCHSHLAADRRQQVARDRESESGARRVRALGAPPEPVRRRRRLLGGEPRTMIGTVIRQTSPSRCAPMPIHAPSGENFTALSITASSALSTTVRSVTLITDGSPAERRAIPRCPATSRQASRRRADRVARSTAEIVVSTRPPACEAEQCLEDPRHPTPLLPRLLHVVAPLPPEPGREVLHTQEQRVERVAQLVGGIERELLLRVMTRSISSAMPLNTCAMRRSSGGPASSGTRASICPARCHHRLVQPPHRGQHPSGEPEDEQHAQRDQHQRDGEMIRSCCTIAARGASTSPATSTAPITSPSSKTGSASAASATVQGKRPPAARASPGQRQPAPVPRPPPRARSSHAPPPPRGHRRDRRPSPRCRTPPRNGRPRHRSRPRCPIEALDARW